MMTHRQHVRPVTRPTPASTAPEGAPPGVHDEGGAASPGPTPTAPSVAGLDDPERGDVPGWVLVTLMTAGLVIALWAVAGPALQGVFETAIQRVTSVG
jgi:hypothetical protein